MKTLETMNTTKVVNEDLENMTILVKPKIGFTQVDDDIVLIGPEDQEFYGINFMGALIWNQILEKTCTVKAVCEHIRQVYDVSEQQCLSDVSKFLGEMRDRGFLTLTQA